MTNKLYNKLINLLKKNSFFLLTILVILLTFIEFPYYINAPGGIVNLDKRIIIENEYKSKGSINMAYVSEYKANIFTLAYAYLNPNYDIIKKEDYLATNDTYENMNYRESLELEESFDNATILGYLKANEKIDIISNKMYVTYIYSEASTDLEVKDQIIKINDIEVNTKLDISNILNSLAENIKIDIEVLNNDKIYHRYAYIKNINNIKVIGIYITEDKEYEVDKKINIKFKRNESGPSGGLMLSLEIYNELISVDITKGYKIAGTGTIDIDGKVGSIGGVKYKLNGAARKHVNIFFVPTDNYEEALKEKEKNNYKMDIIAVNNFDEAINYLNNL